MWSPAILLLLVGVAFANHQNGYKEGKEYTYKVRSRTLAALNSQSKQFTGVVMEARLTVQSNGQETLRAKITQPRYSQIHTRLDDGWDSDIPNSQNNLQNFPLNSEPFEIKMKNGVVRELIVNRNLKTWEVNVLKSIVSQMQVDTEGQNAKKSKHNHLPEGKQPFAMFKVMEDSVGGECEVLYDISPLPEHVLRNNPELAPLPDFRDDGDMISLVKTKNYSNCEQRVSFHSGLNGRDKLEPGSNDNGKYLSRSSVSRVILSGNLKKYTIQSSVTINKVVLNPDQHEFQQGIVASKMNLTLHSVESISEEISAPSNPQSAGNLVYNYNNPFESSSSRWTHKSRKHWSNDNDSQEDDKKKNRRKHNDYGNSDESSSNSDSSENSNENNDNDDDYLQPKPKLTDAPHNPMLAYFIGNNGQSIQKNNKVDAVKSSRNIAQQIGNEMQQPDSMPDEQTLEKFSILTRLIRTMNADQIANAQRDLYEKPRSHNQVIRDKEDQNVRRNAWLAFRDAVAQAGTGPALVNIRQWVQSKQIEGMEAANVIDTAAKSTQTPTPEYMDTFFDLATMQMTVDQPTVRNAAILSFADLVRHAIVNKQSAHNRYPVHAFGRFISKKKSNLHDKYIPYIAKELKSAIESGSSKKIQLYSTALGRTAHPRMLSVFEPYLEGKKQVSMYQRLVMVLSMNKLASIYPKIARSVLYKIYSNNADDSEVRTAAVYLLMKTNPSASMLQRMAEYTNYDSSKQVNSAVKSTIKSLAQLDTQDDDLSDAAKAAEPLLTPEDYRPQFSRMLLAGTQDSQTDSGYSIEANYIGSTDSIIPKGIYLNINPIYRGLQVPQMQFGASVSSVQNMFNFMGDKLSNFNQKISKSKQKAQQEKLSPENIINALGIQGDDAEQVEGLIFMNTRHGNHFLSFDNHSMEQIPKQLKQMEEAMKEGRSFNETKLSNYEVTMSFPMETGWPLTFTLQIPTVMSVNGKLKTKSENDSGNQSPIPKSATISGKMRFIYAMKIQKRLSFVVPFESQEYTVGVDRNLQIHLPVRSEIEFDRKKQEAVLRLQPIGDEQEYKVLQYKTQPFTSKHDILSLQPVQTDRNTHTIHKDRATSSQIEFNDKHNQQRLQFHWERQPSRSNDNQANENRHLREKAMDAANKLARSMAILYNPNEPEKSEYEKYSVKVASKSDISAEMRISYDSLTSENSNKADDSDSWSPKAKVPNLESNLNEQERKHKLLKEAAKNINFANAKAVDISLEVTGGVQTSATVTVAASSSNIDEKSRFLVVASAKTNEGKDYYLSAGFEARSPNTDSLDYEESLKANTPRELDGEIQYGKGSDRNNEQSQNKIRIQGKAKLSEERKKEIRLSRDAQFCSKQESQNGNKMSKSCQKVNQRASTVDKGELTIKFEKESTAKEMAMSVLDTVESISQNVITVEKDRQDKEDKNEIKVAFEMLSKDRKMDVTVKTPEGKLRLKKIYNIQNNDNDEELEDEIMTNTCHLDKTEAETFDNHRYDLELGKCWYVAMTANPKNDPDRSGQQLDLPEDMHVTILTREDDNGNKELKVTLGDNEVNLWGSSSRRVQVKVNNEKIEYSKQNSYQEKKNGDILFELLELQDKSVQLISDRYDVKITYDGSRAEIKAGSKYLESVRGLCGNNDGDLNNDQQTPKGCLLRKADEFAATYALLKDKYCDDSVRQKAEKTKSSKCHYQSTRLGNVISEQEAGRETQRNDNRDDSSNEESRCMSHRTKIIKTENEICFSLRPVPSCSSSCRPKNVKTKNIQFHCVNKSSAAEKVAQRIEKGANPDLSQKSVSKVEEFNIPISCKA
ncbi:PREDICTED: vitellogenin-like [Ceratosolen solmsi marchali]|uniref:Vitellogenin-like n=1 Tax=Ceratosolen solmsi marchali TaxID=326594 RepID=A0AAJ7DXQ3_9HYME|nr:PREDICTED: vitellogenin-like [Ceratosolen solmsi marchali]